MANIASSLTPKVTENKLTSFCYRVFHKTQGYQDFISTQDLQKGLLNDEGWQWNTEPTIIPCTLHPETDPSENNYFLSCINNVVSVGYTDYRAVLQVPSEAESTAVDAYLNAVHFLRDLFWRWMIFSQEDREFVLMVVDEYEDLLIAAQ